MLGFFRAFVLLTFIHIQLHDWIKNGETILNNSFKLFPTLGEIPENQ